MSLRCCIAALCYAKSARKRFPLVLSLLCLASLAVISGCSKISFGGLTFESATLSLTPTQVIVPSGGSQHFAALISGVSDASITWSIQSSNTTSNSTNNSTSDGSISEDGVYTAPDGLDSASSILITATLSAHPSVSSTARITVLPATITVSPSAATVDTNASLAFTTKASGLRNTQVVWTVNSIAGGNATLGMITASGVYTAPAKVPSSSVTILAKSATNARVTGSATVRVQAPSGAPAANASYYGSALQFDVLNNLPVAQADVDYRFRAEHSGPVASFVWYNVYKRGGSLPGCVGAQCECDGYGCGTGGSIQICIYADDGTALHLPVDPVTQRHTNLQASPMACVTPNNMRSGVMLHKEIFATQPMLAEGTLYHLHWHNSDAQPTANFISVDDDCVWHSTVPRQPTIADEDLAAMIMYEDAGSVHLQTVATDTPIYQLNYADGTTQGQGYIAAWNTTSATISGSAMVREIFTITDFSRMIVAAHVRVNRVSGSSPLLLTLATQDGNVLAQGLIASDNFPSGPALDENAFDSQYVAPAWGAYNFPAAVSLQVGQGYQLVLSTADDTLYQDYGIEQGNDYPLSAPSFFGDGYGQFSTDAGETWQGFTQPDGTATGSMNRKNADIQFYFTEQ